MKLVKKRTAGSTSPVRRKYWSSLQRMLTGSAMLTLREEQFFLVLAVIIGAMAALAVVLFRVAISAVRWMALGSGLHPGSPRVFIAPALVGLLIAVLVNRYFPRAGGSGINQTKSALYIYDGYVGSATTVGKFLTSTLAIGSGQSLGPEDPALQIGAGIASLLGRRLRISRERLRLLAPVGAAAGLAAAFNAPITAVLFVIEEVIGRWTAGILGAVVVAAITSTVVERWFLGQEALFRVPEYHLANPGELLAYAALGVLGGVASVVFVKFMTSFRQRLRSLPSWTQYLQPAAAGLLIGVIGIRFPQVMGAGYSSIDQAMNAGFGWEILGILAGLKILATAFSFTSNTPGGLFAPTLFIGAMLGGMVGGLEQAWFPHLSISVGAYALVGMGVLVAGILRAPMTSIFMILEVSGNYSIILPVVVANSVAYLISRGFQRAPVFDLLSRQDGLDLPSLEEEREAAILRVEHALSPSPENVLDGNGALSRALDAVRDTEGDFFLVQMPGGRWSGVSRRTLLELEPNGSESLGSRLHMFIPALYPDQSLETALRYIRDWPFLPVVHRADPRMLIGIISLQNVIDTYRKAGVQEPEEELQSS